MPPSGDRTHGKKKVDGLPLHPHLIPAARYLFPLSRTEEEKRKGIRKIRSAVSSTMCPSHEIEKYTDEEDLTRAMHTMSGSSCSVLG